MNRFADYVQQRDRLPIPAPRQIREVSEYFPRAELNGLWTKMVGDLLAADHPLTAEAKKELRKMKSMDVVAYIDKTLRSAGFQEPDLDNHVQDILIKMLVTGTLFTNFRQGSFRARFLVSLKNAVRTLIKKKSQLSRHQELVHDLPSSIHYPAGVDDEFRQYVLDNLGQSALDVLDHRLSGGETKEMVGSSPVLSTAYAVKQAVRSLKKAWERYSRPSGSSRFSKIGR